MPDGPTINQLDEILSTQAAKEVTANELFDAVGGVSFGGRHASASAALTWAYYGGKYRNGSNVTTMLANGNVTLTASTTNYVEFSNTSGLVTVNTSGFTSGRTPLYTVITGTSTVTSWVDERVVTLATTP
jgi:hypothetical protein